MVKQSKNEPWWLVGIILLIIGLIIGLSIDYIFPEYIIPLIILILLPIAYKLVKWFENIRLKRIYLFITSFTPIRAEGNFKKNEILTITKKV